MAFPGALGAVAVAALLAGCSSDVSRFDYPAFGLTSQNPQSRPIPPEPVYDGAASSAPTPNGAPPPDYNNNYGSAGPRYPYRPGAPYAGGAPSYTSQTYTTGNAPAGFGTVPGQPESYHPEQFGNGNKTAYIITPAAGTPGATSYGNAPPVTSPAAAATPTEGLGRFSARRPKSGSTVEVLPGETLYQFARRNGVSISALMETNHLRSPIVHAGDRLMIPGKGGRSILPPVASAEPGTSTPAAAAPAAAVAVASQNTFVPSDDNPDGTYTVKAGDSVYSIARRHNIRPDAIMAANGITDVTKVRFGQVLRLPGATAANAGGARPGFSGRLASLDPPPARGAAPVMTDAVTEGIPEGVATDEENAAPAAGDAPRAKAAAPKATFAAKPAAAAVKTSPVDPASTPVVASAAPAAAASTAAGDPPADGPTDGRFRWPVRGRIIGKFGAGGPSGQQNEGIDLAVPLGTEVHAAESGVVAYAGDELKGYGKLVLIRHADNWVTAYAHNDDLLVKRGDQIRRGQVIAKAGKSGGIDQPLLHFELRQGSQPVDPMPHMASN